MNVTAIGKKKVCSQCNEEAADLFYSRWNEDFGYLINPEEALCVDCATTREIFTGIRGWLLAKEFQENNYETPPDITRYESKQKSARTTYILINYRDRTMYLQGPVYCIKAPIPQTRELFEEIYNLIGI